MTLILILQMRAPTENILRIMSWASVLVEEPMETLEILGDKNLTEYS
jgi:hypothetical protein